MIAILFFVGLLVGCALGIKYLDYKHEKKGKQWLEEMDNLTK